MVVLGSTGVLGRRVVDLALGLGFDVVGLSAGSNIELLADQIARTGVRVASVGTDQDRRLLTERCSCEDVGWGHSGLDRLASLTADALVLCIPDMVGVFAAMRWIEAGKKLICASKEVAVAAGAVMRAHAAASGAEIVPLDSELTALHLLLADHGAQVSTAVLTASGGSLLGRKDLASVTPADVLRHPVWSMGPKVSVDSASFVNKAFEIVIAHHLLGLPAQRLSAVIHPECRVHAMVGLDDGTWRFHVAPPTMDWAIAACLSGVAACERAQPKDEWQPFDGALSFLSLDPRADRAMDLAREAMNEGGCLSTWLSAADSVAVEAFLSGTLPFTSIVPCIETTMDVATAKSLGACTSTDAVMDAHREATNAARRAAEKLARS
ncbi:MAG: hypothetical protein J7M25_06510 [Deltaproteobacteria bacterium]|nr:hypothetical protein [Deltaproteobacteria bacterium]